MTVFINLIRILCLVKLIDASDLVPECEYWASSSPPASDTNISQNERVFSLLPSRFRKFITLGCHEKPQIMWSICPRSCRKHSKDLSESCGAWAKNGECTKNPTYMQIHCPESCGFAIAWNPFLRNQLGISNVSMNVNMIENLLQPCQVPLNLMNVADILFDRLYLYLEGNADLVWTVHQQSPLDYYHLIGILEMMNYILKIYELFFLKYQQVAKATLISEKLSAIQSILFETLQTTMKGGSSNSFFSTGFNMATGIGLSGEVGYDLGSLDNQEFDSYINQIREQFPVWEQFLYDQYDHIHTFYEQQYPGIANDDWSRNNGEESIDHLLLNQCYDYQKMDFPQLLYYYFEECDTSNGYCLDSKADFLQNLANNPRDVDQVLQTSSSKRKASPTSASSRRPARATTSLFEDEDDEDGSELPIPPSDFSSRKYPSYPPSYTLIPYYTLANGLQIPKLGISINLQNSLTDYSITTLIVEAISIGYRLFEIMIDDPVVDTIIGNTLQSIFTSTSITREEIFILLRYQNHSYPAATDSKDSSEEYYESTNRIQQSLQERLQRLQLSYIDLYLLDTPPVSAQEELALWEGMSLLYEYQLVQGIGVSNYDSYSLQQLITSLSQQSSRNNAAGVILPMIIYNKMDLYHYGSLTSPLLSTIEEWNDLLYLVEEYQMVMMGYSPFSGYPYFLRPLSDPVVQYIANRHTLFSLNVTTPTTTTSTRADQGFHSTTSNTRSQRTSQNNNLHENKRAKSSRFSQQPSSHSSNDGMLSDIQIQEVAKEKVITPAQVILRYFLEQHVGMIFSSQTVNHLVENWKVWEMYPLTEYEMSLIESLQYLVGNYHFLSR